MPIDTMEPLMPRALPRSWGGKASVTMAMPRAMSMEAPMACTTRKPMSQPMLDARPHRTEPAVKMTKPAV